ncbi:MAG: hypothetical protein LBR98_00895 [Syntrophomonadaceae bacterium]|nr:hypothetical protein [Syntrophomonadaceae bacterium]
MVLYRKTIILYVLLSRKIVAERHRAENLGSGVYRSAVGQTEYAVVRGRYIVEVISKADYELVADEIYRLREQKQKVQLENAGRDELKKRISDMATFLQEQPTTLTEYDESLVRRLIEKVTVYKGTFTVEFKSGVSLDILE